MRNTNMNFEQIRRARAAGRGHGRGPRGQGPEGFGPGAWGGPPPWEWGGPRGNRGRGGPRVRRGDVRVAILGVLKDAQDEGQSDLNGYQVISEIEEKTAGAWKPSPGSIYPTISQLEDEGLVEVVREGGKKVLRLTADGNTWVTDHADEVEAVWRAFEDTDGTEVQDLKKVLKQTMGAVGQVFSTGTPEQRQQAVEILDDTRRQLFKLLAD